MVHIYQVVFFCLLSVCNGGVVPHLSPLISQGPLVNQGPQLGPLTAAYGDLVQTPRGLASISLEGLSEDLNQDGYVDPVGQAVAVAAPAVAIASPAPTYNIAASAFGVPAQAYPFGYNTIPTVNASIGAQAYNYPTVTKSHVPQVLGGIATPQIFGGIANSQVLGGLATSPQVFGGFATPLVHPTGCINHLGSAVPC